MVISMQKTYSLTAFLGVGLIASAHACTSASPSPSDPSALDAAANPPQGDAASPSPAADTGEPRSDAASSGPMDGEGQKDSQAQDNRDASVSLSDAADAAMMSRGDAADAALMPRGDGGSSLPLFDAGVTLGCAANPNPPDPTVGWAEFSDAYPPAAGVLYPNLQYPYNLGPQDNCTTNLPITDINSPCRFSLKGGVYTYWIFQNDLSHMAPDSGLAPTDPRIEMRWSSFMATDPHPQRMWTGDMVILGANNGAQPAHNCVLQVHTDATGQGPVYLRVEGGNLFQLGGPTYFRPTVGRWFNLKVAFNARTLQSTVWVNNCQVGTWNGSSFVGAALPGGDVFYFKNGSYGCATGECIVQAANVHFFWK